ncbi:MAG: DUF3427 domain-containing protein [Microthrixaceae bacterium]
MSVFSSVAQSEWIASNRSAFAIFDGFPVSEGHALVISRREIATWWDASADEQIDLMSLVAEVKQILDHKFDPDGYNVGFNAGSAAGQTVDHLHIHVIPRRAGDVDDPRGGIRHVMPNLGNYLVPDLSDSRPPEWIAVPVALEPPQIRDSRRGAAVPTSATLIDSRGPRRMHHELIDCLRSTQFDRVDLLVSFIMKSGLRLIRDRLDESLARGALVRVLTTDYLNITDADALAELLDLSESHRAVTGALSIRVFSDPLTSFHPKAYLFHSSAGERAAGFVGSSNLSRSGIDGGIEWSLEVDQVTSLVESFDELWVDPRSRSLDHDFLRTYRTRWRSEVKRSTREIEIGAEVEPPAEPVEPRPIQIEGLQALRDARSAGHQAGLVVMATGLGKTWLAAFDSVDVIGASGVSQRALSTGAATGRVLFIAHREEILGQSRDVYRQVAPNLELGLYNGSEKQPDADVVFASIQTISRRLDLFSPDAFDYIVVDEFHHAAAASYRVVLDHFQPEFLLGLTATPQRMDGADLMALCGDNLVFECGLVEGIDRSALVPFHYWGIADVIDYEPIPWRNGKFDPQALAQAVETQARAEQTLDEWRNRCGGRTLAFCASVTHADFMAEYFNSAGVVAVAVHSGPTSASRVDAVDSLRDGTVEVVFTVDVFNEGVDIPEIDSVMMLRPTGSPVIFLQQLGRGLRISEGKDFLNVVDLVGNHASFLLKPRILLGLGSPLMPTNSQVMRAMAKGDFQMPAGCSVKFDLELIDIFAALVGSKGTSRAGALEEYCLDSAEEAGQRPTAVQAHAAGFDPAAARSRHGGWYSMLSSLRLLNDDEQAVVAAHGDLLRRIETEPITKSYKLVTLRALIADGTLRTGTTVAEVAQRSHRLIVADPRLVLDARSKAIPEPREVSPAAWKSFWRRNPLFHLAKSSANSPALFELDGDDFSPTFSVSDGLGDTFDQVVAEIVGWRLASYLLNGRDAEADGESEDHDVVDGESSLDSTDQLDQNREAEGPSHLIGERFRRNQISEMFGLDFNPAKWNLGHVSLGGDVVLFVTLKKSSAMQYGSDYVDHFESPSEFVWASQNSVGPSVKKGREILGAVENGVRLHLFVRLKKADVAFEYCGLVEPISHHGEKPMSVTFRLKTPLGPDAAKRFVTVG